MEFGNDSDEENKNPDRMDADELFSAGPREVSESIALAADAYGNLSYNFGTFAEFFSKFTDLPDVTEYLTAVEQLIRDLNQDANDIEKQENTKQNILLKVQSLAHCKYGTDSYNCGILVKEANDQLQYYGYGNQLLSAPVQQAPVVYIPEPEEPYDPESAGIDIEDNGIDIEDGTKVEEPAAKYIDQKDIAAIYNAPPPKMKDYFEDHEKTEAEVQLEKDVEMTNKTVFEDMIKMGKKDIVKTIVGAEDWLNDPKIKKFTVVDPAKVSGHVKYTCTGTDSQGDFSQARRFSEFHALGQALSQRWPGCYIPSFPEKQLIKLNADKLVLERKNLLNTFFKECAKYDYILNCKEFEIFSRGSGDIGKTFSSLPKQKPLEILEKYRKVFEVEDTSDVTDYKNNTMQMMSYLKRVIPIMKQQKNQMNTIANVRDVGDKGQTKMLNIFKSYEEIGLAYYAKEQEGKKNLTHPKNEEISNKIDESETKWVNSFRESYYWIKNEFSDAQGMYGALEGRESLMKDQLALEKKIKSDQNEVNKLTEGKKTMKSIFKSKSKKEDSVVKINEQIEAQTKEVDDYRELIKFVTIYHGQIAIPKYKASKVKQYMGHVNNFCVKEITNAHYAATLYHEIMQATPSVSAPSEKAEIDADKE